MTVCQEAAAKAGKPPLCTILLFQCQDILTEFRGGLSFEFAAYSSALAQTAYTEIPRGNKGP
jgi:hypothetical protein